MKRLRALFLAICLASLSLSAACDAARAAITPTLDEVLGAVDSRRVLECRALMVEDPKAAAKCLGASAMSAGLRLALNKAGDLIETIKDAAGPAGADDMAESERASLADDLDASLKQLAHEIAVAQ